jgi:hypothetical protein
MKTYIVCLVCWNFSIICLLYKNIGLLLVVMTVHF